MRLRRPTVDDLGAVVVFTIWLGLVVLAAVLLSGCGQEWDPGFFCAGSGDTDPLVHKIVNGEPAEDSLATVELVYEDRFACTAAALDERTVLTAAHCLRPERSYHIRKGEALVEVEEVYVHPLFVPLGDYDLAVLHLADDLEGPFPEGIYDPAAGGVLPDLRHYCTHLLVQGHGRRAEGAEPGLYELEHEVGELRWHSFSGQAVDDPSTQAVCQGDSGGPMYAFTNRRDAPGTQMWLAGIIIRGNLEGCWGRSTFIFLENFSPWIREVRRCAAGGEDRLWSFYMESFRGDTCEDLRQ